MSSKTFCCDGTLVLIENSREKDLIHVNLAFYLQTYEEWKDMLPDFSEYNWVIPDFVWELSEQIDLGKCFNHHEDLFSLPGLGFLIKDLTHYLLCPQINWPKLYQRWRK